MSEQNATVKGVADIVFVIDCSWSMSKVIDALKKHITDFVDTLLNDIQSTVKDVRLGLVFHGIKGSTAIRTVDFMSSPSDFRDALQNSRGGGNEYGLPAIDRALDFPWRSECRRYIVFFSDEAVDDGHDPDFQKEHLYELGTKMSAMHVHFIGFNEEDCPAYSLLGRVPGSSYTVVSREELEGANMQEVLKGVAKTVSIGVDDEIFSNVKNNLYKLR